MRLVISNLNRLTTISQVVALLLPFGLVTSGRIVMNSKNGFSEGTALVDIDYNAGQMAINQLNNIRFMNCYIGVEENIPGKLAK
jgi:RNA recognition motif-containing protein